MEKGGIRHNANPWTMAFVRLPSKLRHELIFILQEHLHKHWHFNLQEFRKVQICHWLLCVTETLLFNGSDPEWRVRKQWPLRSAANPSSTAFSVHPYLSEGPLYVVLRRAIHRRLQSFRFSIHLASSFLLSAPASFLSMSTKVGVGHPLDRYPCLGSHSKSFLAGKSWCRCQWPASLILLTAILSDTLGNALHRHLLEMGSPWLMFSTTRNFLV